MVSKSTEWTKPPDGEEVVEKKEPPPKKVAPKNLGKEKLKRITKISFGVLVFSSILFTIGWFTHFLIGGQSPLKINIYVTQPQVTVRVPKEVEGY